MSAMIATRPLPRNPHADNPGERGRTWLDRLFGGDFSFPAIHSAALPPGERAPAEYDAVSRAAGCRDLFVIHADTPAGERVITDLARSVTAAERVLILTPNSVAADRIAERLLKCGVSVLRSLADDENPVRPSPAVSKITSTAIGNASTERARKEATAAVAAAEQRVAAFAVVSKAIARLREVNDLLKTLDADLAEKTARRKGVEVTVADEVASRHATAFSELMDRRKSEHDAALAGVIERRIATRKAADDKETEVNALRQQYASATKKSGFLVRIFTKAKPAVDTDELAKHLQTAEAELAVLTTAANAQQAELERQSSTFAAERQKLIADEVASRRSVLDATISTVESERTRAQTEAAALNKVIGAAVPGEDHTAAERQLSLARQRAGEVAVSAPELIIRALAEPRVVVGIPKSLDADPVFTSAPEEPPFGLLILDRAEELPEPEFSRLSLLAERWVLVGEALPPAESRSQNGRPARNGRTTEVPFVYRLAKSLDRETWAMEGDRLVCRLSPLTPEQRREMTREPLADRPEIELRFVAPEGEPILAEIAFPTSLGVPDAKSFLFHTLGEVLFRTCGEFTWKHEAAAITAVWTATDTSAGVWIDLESGVREKITGSGLFAFTAAVSFDTAAGWDAEKAQAWLANCLPPLATSRFAALPRSPGPRASS
jgi:hypothetical protein